MTMKYIELLGKILDLTPEKNRSLNEELEDICRSYDTDASKGELYTYTTFELNRRFDNFDVHEMNFNLTNTPIWEKFLGLEAEDKGYVAALQIVICLIETSIVNKQAFAKQAAMKPLIKARLKSKISNPLVRASFEDLLCNIVSVQGTSDDIQYIYEDTYPYSWNIVSKIAALIEDPSLRSHLLFENSFLQFSQLMFKETFTVFLEVEILGTVSNRIITLGTNVFIEIHDSKLCISNDEYITALFDGFEFDLHKLYCIVLCFDSGSVTLFVDELIVQTIALTLYEPYSFSELRVGSFLSFFRLFKLTVFDNCFSPLEVLQMKGLTAFQEQTNVAFDIDINFTIESKGKDERSFSLLDVTPYSTAGKCFYYKATDIAAFLENMNTLEVYLYRIYMEKDKNEIETLILNFIPYLRHQRLNEIFSSFKGYSIWSHILLEKATDGYQISSSIIEKLFHLLNMTTAMTAKNLKFHGLKYQESPLSLLLNLNLFSCRDFDGLNSLFSGLLHFFSSQPCKGPLKTDCIILIQRSLIHQLHCNYEDGELLSVLEGGTGLSKLLYHMLECDIDGTGCLIHLQYSFFAMSCDRWVLAKVLLQTLKDVAQDHHEQDRELLSNRISKSMYAKVFLMMLETCIERLDFVRIIYSLLLYLFDHNPGFLEQFMNTKGFSIICSVFLTHSKDPGELLECLISITNHRFETRVVNISEVTFPKEDKCSLFSHLMIADILEDFLSRDPFSIQNFLMWFFDYLKRLHRFKPDHMLFETTNHSFLKKLCHLQVSLVMTNVEDLLEISSNESQLFLSEVIVDKVKNSDLDSFKCFISDIIFNNIQEGKSTKTFRQNSTFAFAFILVPGIFALLSKASFSDVLVGSTSTHIIEKIMYLLNCSSINWKVHDPNWNTLKDIHLVISKAKELIFLSKDAHPIQIQTLKSLTSTHEMILEWMLSYQLQETQDDAFDSYFEEVLHSFLFFQEVLFIERSTQLAFSNVFLSNLLTVLFDTIPFLKEHACFLALNVFRTVCTLRSESLEGISKLSSSSYKDCINLLKESMTKDDEQLLQLIQEDNSKDLFDKRAKKLQSIFTRNNFTEEKFKRSNKSYFMHIIFQSQTDAYRIQSQTKAETFQLFRRDNNSLSHKMIMAEDKRLHDFITDDMYYQDSSCINTLRLLRKFAAITYLRNLKSRRTWTIADRENLNRQRKQLYPVFGVVDYSRLPLERKYVLHKGHEKRNLTASSTSDSEYNCGSDIDNAITSGDYFDSNRSVLQLLQDNESVKRIWNCTNVKGLDVLAGIIVLTSSTLYFIPQCYYDNISKKVLDLRNVPITLRNPTIDYLSSSFTSKLEENDWRSRLPTSLWDLNLLNYVIERPFLLRDTGLELFFGFKRTVMFTFRDQTLRDEVYKILKALAFPTDKTTIWSSILNDVDFQSRTVGCRNGISKVSVSNRLSTALTAITHHHSSVKMQELWNNGSLSNFDYLMAINTLAGRTFNDLTQYPIFPWVLSDYESENIDLKDPTVYRDLSRPMGAQTESRKLKFIDRFEALRCLDDEATPPFHYGTHYSSAMIVSSYLVRLQPFSDTYKVLQGGSWGPPDRLFNSVKRAWKSASAEATTDVRELIPEFFYLPGFFLNKNGYDFGNMQNGQEVSDVELPPWAKNDPQTFVEINRQALESQYVSEHLHEWIDLVFGYKQRGPEAVKAVNVFNALSYPGNVDINEIDDKTERDAITGIIHNFGQTPLQIFHKPHPPRSTITYKDRKYFGLTKFETVTMCNSRDKNELDGKLEVTASSNNGFTVNGRKYAHAHSSYIKLVKILSPEKFATADVTGLIKIWSYCKGITQFSTSLCGHEGSVKQICASLQYDIVISLDKYGTVISWNLENGDVINKFTVMSRLVSISENTGNVAIVSDTGVLLFDTNGSIVCKMAIPGEVQSISFMKNDKNWSFKYHQELDTLLIAVKDKIVLFHLKLTEEGWNLVPIQTLEDSKVRGIRRIRALSEIVIDRVMTRIFITDENNDTWCWK